MKVSDDDKIKGAVVMLFKKNEKSENVEERATKTTLGENISALRKEKGLTQEELSEALGVSPQAVSKWENNLSCPDIMLLPDIAEIFEISVDELLTGKKSKYANTDAAANIQENTDNAPVVKAKNIRIIVKSPGKNDVNVTVPIKLVKVAIKFGTGIPQISGNLNITDAQITEIMNLAEMGVTGKLIDVDTGNGETVEIIAE